VSRILGEIDWKPEPLFKKKVIDDGGAPSRTDLSAIYPADLLDELIVIVASTHHVPPRLSCLTPNPNIARKIDIRQVAQQPPSQLVANSVCANGGWWLW
jgi:hypothetical protein